MLNEPLPLQHCSLGCLCISIAGQIDKKERPVEPVKINALSFSWRRAGSCQFLVAGEPVNQAGLPDIRSARKNHFGNSLLREITFRDGADDKFGLDHRRSCGAVSMRNILIRTSTFDIRYRGNLPRDRRSFQGYLQDFIHCFH